MPSTRVAVKQGTSPERKKAIVQGVHQAMVDSIRIPHDDYFQLISEYNQGDFLAESSVAVQFGRRVSHVPEHCRS